MEINVKLIGSLRDRMPPGGKLELPDKATIQDVLRVLDIPDQRVQVISINNQFERDRSRQLHSNDEVTVLPAVVGG